VCVKIKAVVGSFFFLFMNVVMADFYLENRWPVPLHKT